MNKSLIKPASAFLLLLGTLLGVLQGGEGWALWPAVVAIGAVLMLRSVPLGLLLGALAGSFLLSEGNLLHAFVALFDEHVLGSFESRWKISALVFTLLLGGFAAVIEQGGGLRPLLKKIGGEEGSERRLQGTAFGLGLLCFFDGLANSMLVGRVLRRPAARLGVSAEKMAYVVDSTSSAVACLAVMSTWIAFQLQLIAEAQTTLGLTANPFRTFLMSIPYNFYCWFTLILLGLVISRQWNIGPMAVAEERARERALGKPEEKEAPAGSIWSFLIPLLSLLAALFGGLYLSGRTETKGLGGLADAFGAADAALVLVCASALAGLVAIASNLQRERPKACFEAYHEGLLQMVTPLLILVCAWTLSSTLDALGAAPFLADAIVELEAVPLYAALIFGVGVLISFTTGSSWGTMGVLMPIALPAAYTLAPEQPDLALATIGAVFSGAVFGDHCSPFSDTTIVSATASGCSPLEHVLSQLPYALIAASTALLLGFLPTGFGLAPHLLLGAGTLLLAALAIYGSRSKR